MIPSSILFVFTLLLAIVSAGQFGIKLDENLAPTKNGKHRGTDGWYLWSSYIEVKKTPTKGQLANMVNDAFAEIGPARKQEGVGSRFEPKVMAALAVDNEVFFASSMKADGSYVYKDDCEQDKSQFRANLLEVPDAKQLQGTIEQCMNDAKEESKNPVHQNSAKCGEISATYAWLLKHKGAQLRNKNPKPLIAAATRKGLMDPCGSDSRVGCKDVVGEKGMNFDPVTTDTKSEDYADIFVKVVGQQELVKKELAKARQGRAFEA